MLEDIAVLTGGQLISEDLGIKLENVTLDMLGRAKKVSISKERRPSSTAPEKPAIKARIAQIKAQIEETTSDYDKEKLQERLGEALRRRCVIRVGGGSEIEVKETEGPGRRRAERDARRRRRRYRARWRRCAAARQEGGQGLTSENADIQAGIKIVLKALEAPIRQIAQNSGVDGSIVVGKVFERSPTHSALMRRPRNIRILFRPGSSIRPRLSGSHCKTPPRSRVFW